MDIEEQSRIAIIKADYFSLLADYALNDADIIEDMNSVGFDSSSIDGVYVGRSVVSGDGVFSERGFEPADYIGDTINIDEQKKTLLGRKVNHSPQPNAFIDGVKMYALKSIELGEELFVDYRQSFAGAGLVRANAASTEISADVTPRSELSGICAAVHDLLFGDDHIANMSKRERVLAFEAAVALEPQVEFQVEHEFIDGLYKRKLTFPKNGIATGAIHPVDHMDVMLKGEMIVATDDGFKHIKAPFEMTSRAWEKKAGIALQETVWISYHPTSATTVEEVEAEIFCDTFNEIEIRGDL